MCLYFCFAMLMDFFFVGLGFECGSCEGLQKTKCSSLLYNASSLLSVALLSGTIGFLVMVEVHSTVQTTTKEEFSKKPDYRKVIFKKDKNKTKPCKTYDRVGDCQFKDSCKHYHRTKQSSTWSLKMAKETADPLSLFPPPLLLHKKPPKLMKISPGYLIMIVWLTQKLGSSLAFFYFYFYYYYRFLFFKKINIYYIVFPLTFKIIQVFLMLCDDTDNSCVYVLLIIYHQVTCTFIEINTKDLEINFTFH